MRLTQTDASFIYMESASGPMHIAAVYVLDGELPFDDIFTWIQTRMHLLPSLRRKLAQVPFSLAHPKWVDDDEFDLANHIVHHQLPEGSSLEDGVNQAVEMNEAMLDRSLPLWRMVVLSGVPGKTLMLQQTHHALVDGASSIQLQMIVFSFEKNAANPEPPQAAWVPETPPSLNELFSEAVRENVESMSQFNPTRAVSNVPAQWQKVQQAVEIMNRFVSQPAITAPFNAGMVGPKRRVAWLKKSFSEIREIRRHLGGTINDVVLAVVSEAVARYLESHGERVQDQHMRIMCPVNVRTEDQKGALGNQVSAIFPMLPAWSMDTLKRLEVVISETQRIKGAEEAQAMTQMQDSMPNFPPTAMLGTQLIGTAFDPTALAARMPLPIIPSFGARPPNPGVNFTCTNVPGVQVPQYICGAELTDQIGLLVLTGTSGFSATILSYNNQLFFNFICEPRLLPDLDVIKNAADDVFLDLLRLAQEKNQALQQSNPE
ncbi:MAG: diacylglycerol O-acyltransferase [Patiriisocius sp.]|jgi:diacylglycerol O-acyltransferase